MEAFLVLVIVGLLGLIGYEHHENRKERSKYLNAILSKDTTEFRDLEIADKTEIKIKPPKQEFELPENMSDEEWYKKEIEPKVQE